jgi:hypothetical protein
MNRGRQDEKGHVAYMRDRKIEREREREREREEEEE